MLKATGLILSFSLFLVSYGINADDSNQNAKDYVVLKALPDEDTSSDCTQRGGLRIFIFNEHPSSSIDLSIDRYFDNVRQPGRSMFALQHGHAQALGCNTVMDAEQYWELIDAEFISEEKAMERYGTLL